MNDSARWKWLLLLVVSVLFVAGLMVNPPAQKLKLGLDLQGGTNFIYEVAVPKGMDVKRTLEQTIEVLKDRVDPNGVMNLVWRRLAGNRFEVQMPAAAPNVRGLRTAYIDARDKLLDSNLSRVTLDRVLRQAPAQRQARLDQLTAGNADLGAQIDALVRAFDAESTARAAADEAGKAHEAAQSALKAASDGAEAPEDVKQSAERALAASIEAARKALAARKTLAETTGIVLASNVEAPLLDAALDQPNKPKAEENPRQIALDQLIERYPGRTEAIRTVAAAYEEYERVKGPLDDPNDFIALMRGSGVLEFRIAATTATLQDSDKYRTQLKEKGPRGDVGDLYRWFLVDKNASFADTASERRLMLDNPASFFAQSNQGGLIGDKFGGKVYLLLSNEGDASLTQADGWELSAAIPTADDRGFPAVQFRLNAPGGHHMGKLTAAHVGQPMAIVLDGRAMSAPNIQSTITSNGIITGGQGGFGARELDYLIRTLNAGSLQALVSEEPIYTKSFDAVFGADNLQRGLNASIWALIVVAVFMAFYYLYNGLIADFALFGNILLILGVMSTNFLGATFTLPGIAGIVLTIGMAVDANVLIFERIREELDQRAQVHAAVRTGYGKALATIIDANLTTLITCVVLGYTATAEVKGFAVTLGIGILATMFTALLGTRVLIELYLHFSHASTLRMMPTLVPSVGRMLHPKIDWVGKRNGFLITSVTLVIVGLIFVTTRGEDMLGIEFRSGTSVSFNLAKDEALDLKDVKQRLDRIAEDPDLAALGSKQATVVITGDAEGTVGKSFSISTLLGNEGGRVANAVSGAFQDVLDIKPALSFDHATTVEIGEASHVVPLQKVRLGENIGRPDVTDEVGDFIGGVAIVVDNLEPATTVKDIRDRIRNRRLQPQYDGYGYRRFDVIGMDLAPSDGDDDTARYRSIVIVSGDQSTNYVTNPNAFLDAGGMADTEWILVRDALTAETSLGSVASFSPQVSSTMKTQAIVAIVLSLLAVVAYIWLRFGSLRYGFAAIVALVHDVTVALGIVALTGWVGDTALGHVFLLTDFKIDLTIVAALLTIVGYSLNDTIVVFDRIRENRGRLATATPAIINDSINQTISRTALTSVTTILALTTLYLFGGTGVRGFAFTMLVGIVVGTYSSIAIAAPIVLFGANRSEN